MKTVLLIVRWIGALLGWCLFFFWWRKAVTPGWVSPRAVLFSLITIATVVSAAVAYSALWIFHNKRLARRGKRGFVSFYKPPRFESDALGRRLKMPATPHDRFANVVIIRDAEGHKEYVSGEERLGTNA